MRIWIRQPLNKNICGQIAVAVITNMSVDYIINLMGKKGCTKTKDLSNVLNFLGYQCPNRCQRIPRPQLGIAHISDPKRYGWHWAVVDGDKIWDGAFGNSEGKVNWPIGWKITSYLPVTQICFTRQQE